MKLHHLLLIGLPLALSCHKNPFNPPPDGPTGLQARITGKWTIITVTTLAYDSSGNPWPNGQNIYSPPPNNFFVFNADNSWTEILTQDTLAADGINGTYTIGGDSSFTLINPLAVSGAEPCRVDTLTTSLLVWEHSRGTHFNGVTPGYLRYLFHMTK